MDKIEKIYELINENCIQEALDLIYENEEELKEYSEFWNVKAILCTKAEEYEVALNCLNVAISIDSENIEYLYNLAYLYELKNEEDNAYEIYTKLKLLVKEENEKIELEKILNKYENLNKNIIIKNKNNSKAAEFGKDIYSARKNMIDSMLEEKSPLVSIFVQAYNNLEKYTKTCVECVLKYTKDINYELILVDNGSSDGTFEYFKTINHPKKKIVRVTKNIGLVYGAYQGYLNCSGKYIVGVPNDLFVTENWLSNMLECVMSDDKIGMVTPCCDYVSNYQSVNLNYSSFEDMQVKAAKYNVSNNKLWEERLRLVTLGTLYKKECLDIIGFLDYGFFHDFADDDITFRIRRAGYKAVLCKDTFVCHAGKITDKGAETSVKSLEKGREIFKQRYNGIDAWNDVEYAFSLVECIDGINIKDNSMPSILGIDTKCGQAILDVKNKLRSKGILKSKLSAFSTDVNYYTDLCTICDGIVAVDRIQYVKEHFRNDKFDYIIIGDLLNKYEDCYTLIRNILDLLKDDGEILLKIKNSEDMLALLRILGANINNDMSKYTSINIEDISLFIKESGGYINKIVSELHQVNGELHNKINGLVKFLDRNYSDKIYINNYLLSIRKVKNYNKI